MRFDWTRKFLLAIAVLATTATEAAPPTFRITSVYSNLDGSVQFIRLTETEGLDRQHHFAGLKLTATRNGVTREYTFAHDLPTENTARASIVIATGALPLEVVGTWSTPWICCGEPHYRFPPRFLPTDGATVEFAGVDRVSYARLPSDGWSALLRDGTVARGELPSSVCQVYMSPFCRTGSRVYIAESTVRAVEYYSAALDHYFIAAQANDIEALDTGRTAGWQRTGLTFAVGASALVMISWNVWDYPFPSSYPMQPVCRFYLPPESGDSHFFSASATECAEVRSRFPHFVYESDAAFYAVLPDLATGKCPEGVAFFLAPVFRVWNGRADTNHRYTLDFPARNSLIAQGWVSEGYGPEGVAFCVPLGI